MALLLGACSSRSADEAPPAPQVAPAECAAFVAAMDRCVGGVAGGRDTVTALRASLAPSPQATEREVAKLKARCAASGVQLAKACK